MRKGKGKWSHSVLSDSATPRTIAYQALPSMGFSTQGYWSGLPFPSPYYLGYIQIIECLVLWLFCLTFWGTTRYSSTMSISFLFLPSMYSIWDSWFLHTHDNISYFLKHIIVIIAISFVGLNLLFGSFRLY